MKKININEFIFILILLFPISTIIQGIQGFNSINKILIGTAIILLFFSFLQTKMKKNNIIILFFTVVIYVFSFIFTEKKIDNFNDIFYFILWILFFIWIKENYECFKKCIKTKINLIQLIIIIWNMIVAVSLFFKESYTQSWGDEFYFKAFSNGEHRFAASCLFIFSLSCIVVTEKLNYKHFVFSILPLISIFLSGTRVYLGVIFVFCGCIYYMICKNKSTFYLSCIPIGIICIFFIMLTPMGEKFVSAINNPNHTFIDAFTNGRSIIWTADIKAFLDLSIIKQLVGNGYNFIYDINESVFARIWAHNDIINILLTYGYIGVVIYVYAFVSMSKKILKNMNISKIIIFCYYFIWIFNAMFNMVYTYTNATFALPFVLYFFTEFKENKYRNDIF